MEPKKKGLDGSKAEIKTCRFCGSEQITKFGFNSLKKRRKQRYRCKHCKKKFTPSEELEKPTKQGYGDLGSEIQANTPGICRLAKKKVYPYFSPELAGNSKYAPRDLLDPLSWTALMHIFTHQGAKTFKLGRKKMSTSRDMLYHFSKFKLADLLDGFRLSLQELLGIARQQNFFNGRKVDIAIDEHELPYYGKEQPMLCRDSRLRGTSFCFKFITLAIVERGVRFTLACLPVSPLSSVPKLVDELLREAKRHVKIGTVYLDRGFYSGGVMKVLNDHKLNWLMVAPENKLVKRLLKEREPGSVVEHEIEGAKLRLRICHKNGEKFAFATNIKASGIRRAELLFRLYGKRWGIETGYRVLEQDFRARTTSPSYAVRLFYFLFGLALYNCWVLVNFLLAFALLSFLPQKPLLPAKEFGLSFVKFDPG
jgi:hypothetical protein